VAETSRGESNHHFALQSFWLVQWSVFFSDFYLCFVLLRGIAMFPQNIAFPVLCVCVVANTIWLGSFKEQIHMKRENRSDRRVRPKEAAG